MVGEDEREGPCGVRRGWRHGEESAGGAGKKQRDDAPPPLPGGGVELQVKERGRRREGKAWWV
jgi:hypothetical protein